MDGKRKRKSKEGGVKCSSDGFKMTCCTKIEFKLKIAMSKAFASSRRNLPSAFLTAYTIDPREVLQEVVSIYIHMDRRSNRRLVTLK